MVFTPSTLFKSITCPYAPQCSLTNCIFSHELRPKDEEEAVTASGTIISSTLPEQSSEPALKRRKITYDRFEDKPPSRADTIRSELAASRQAALGATEVNVTRLEHSLTSLTKPVTPPPTSGKASSHASGNLRRSGDDHITNTKSTSPESKESLNPRLLANDPAGHAKRSLYLKHLHAEMVRLNKALSEASNSGANNPAILSEQQLIKLALDEEEKMARDQPMVYPNVVKQRIALYKKMKADTWRNYVTANLEKDKPKTASHKPVITGLSPEEELLILPYLAANQTGLEKFGYVTSPPTDSEIAEAVAAVETSKNFEVCDRCAARFQVWPDRSEQGRLTSNGPCRHHPNKKAFPHKTRGDIVSGLPKEPYYPCCNNAVGSPGCTVTEDHVFKTSSAARLAATLPFITTPENPAPALDKHGRQVNAVTFDCEMGYTTHGLELIRLTAVSWPSAEPLIDVLVRPLGIIIDLNSRFSGVWPESFSNAIPYSQYEAARSADSTTNGAQSDSLPIVDSPQKARELLCSFITPNSPLIGHAIDNDLNVVRLCHPSIIDTVLLWPHPRGLPIRYGLKMLSSTHLSRHIQMGGDRGHDSLEDAQATGDLVRFKIGERWKVLHSQGWRIKENDLVPPATLRRSEADGQVMEQDKEVVVADMVAKIFDGQAAGKKRRKKRAESGAGETEDEEVLLGNGVATYLKFASGGGLGEPMNPPQ